jgi:hypothetical protein
MVLRSYPSGLSVDEQLAQVLLLLLAAMVTALRPHTPPAACWRRFPHYKRQVEEGESLSTRDPYLSS